uniref:SWIB domain-containing protein n=1 Tax=Steinernema glaseri TaxID=37863 RepID=A0A1I7ZDI0_9BILA
MRKNKPKVYHRIKEACTVDKWMVRTCKGNLRDGDGLLAELCERSDRSGATFSIVCALSALEWSPRRRPQRAKITVGGERTDGESGRRSINWMSGATKFVPARMNRMGPPGPMGAVAPHPVAAGAPAGVRYVQGPQMVQRRFVGQPQMMAPPQVHQSRQMAAFKKKKRYADKIISPNLRELIPESDAYMDLLAYEQKLDATMTRKRLEIQEALKRPQKVKRKLRIYISHTFIAGHAPEREGDEGVVPMWELRVEGRLIDDQPPGQGPTGPGTPAAANAANQPNRNVTKRKFSSFFKSLVIELDKDIYGPDNHLVEWHRTPQTNETDGFQVKRPGQASR